MRTSRIAMLCAVAGTLTIGAGCARRPNAALDHARAAVQQANQSPEITSNGAVALHEAEQELRRAEIAYDKDRDDVVVEHHAYVAERKVDIARANAQQKIAEQEMARLNDERGEVVLESRTGEARAARQEAAVAREELRRLQRELAALHPRQTSRGLVLTLDNVLFEFDRADLKPGAMQDLSKVSAYLREHPDRQVMIEGHTDSLGTEGYNRQLSEARANAVRNYLMRNGVPASQMVASGLGEDSPVATNDTEAGRQQNRRVEIVIGSLPPAGAVTSGVGRTPPDVVPERGTMDEPDEFEDED